MPSARSVFVYFLLVKRNPCLVHFFVSVNAIVLMSVISLNLIRRQWNHYRWTKTIYSYCKVNAMLCDDLPSTMVFVLQPPETHKEMQFTKSVLHILLKCASCQLRTIVGMPGMFSPTPRVSDPDMHHGTCVAHVPWCMTGSLTSGFLWSRWPGKRSRRMCNPRCYVSGKRHIVNLMSCVSCW